MPKTISRTSEEPGIIVSCIVVVTSLCKIALNYSLHLKWATSAVAVEVTAVLELFVLFLQSINSCHIIIQDEENRRHKFILLQSTTL